MWFNKTKRNHKTGLEKGAASNEKGKKVSNNIFLNKSFRNSGNKVWRTVHRM